MSDAMRKFLMPLAFPARDIELFLDPNTPTWGKFDPELGYLMKDFAMQDGVDGACSIYNYERTGQRKQFNYADRPCRINTYGDSFTQNQQVSNGETWQEYLAAHIGEPIRNFGVGGYGVYQAYLRARRVEATALGADYVILNIYDDDHVRNIDACRWIRIPHPPASAKAKPRMIHGTPWSHLRLDLRTGKFVKRAGLCPDAAALRRLCDPEHFYQTFKDDEVARLYALQLGLEIGDVSDLEELAEALGVKADWRNPKKRRDAARVLRFAYGLRATEFLLDEMRAWLKAEGKKLMVILSYRESWIVQGIEGKPREDQRLLDYLRRHKIPFVDLREKHVGDYQRFRMKPWDYVNHYYINARGAAVVGHYSPRGNHFFAFAIKDAVVNWLKPRPITYQGEDAVLAEMVRGRTNRASKRSRRSLR